jgi:hypothetical protein
MAEKKNVRIRLFKDNSRYKGDLFVSVNGVNYKIRRGVEVEVPPEVAEVLEHSQQQDEHTAALDPKTALKVLTLSAKIVEENHLTTMMITHNMKDAIKYGNRLIMMHEGHIIYDVSGNEKKNLQVSDLLAKFQIASGGEFANDRMILS